MNFQRHIDAPLHSLLMDAARLAQDTAMKRAMIVDIEIEQRREKARIWEDSGGESVSARDRYAQIGTLSYETEKLGIESELIPQQAEYDLIVLVLQYRSQHAELTNPATISPA